jgi:WD40 repeat protein
MGQVRDLAISPDGRYLASTGFEAFALWDLKDETLLFELDTIEVDDVAYSPTGKQVAFAYRNDSGARVVDVARRAVEVILDTGTTWAVAFSPDGTRLATAGDSAIIQLWDAETWQLKQEYLGHNARIRRLVFTPDGERLASRGDDDTIRIWDVHSGREVLTIAASPVRDGAIAFSPDGLTLASGTTDGSVMLWPAFPWRDEDYPGSRSLPFAERLELYKREFWREKSPLLKTYTSGATGLPED